MRLDAPDWEAEDTLTLAIPGTPVAQGSKRHVGGGRMIEMNKDLHPWRRDIAMTAVEQNAEIRDGAISVTLDFYFTRPRGHFGKRGLRPSAPARPSVRPDIDKLARAVLDALTGIAFRDDGQVAELVCRKHYAAEGKPPGVTVEIGVL